MVALNGTVLVALQFRFTNSDAITSVVKRLDQETQKEYVVRKRRSSGIMLIEPTTNRHSLVWLLADLESEGYELVDAFYQERPNNEKKDPVGMWTYHMVRFLFARREFVELSDEFKKVQDVIRAELRNICESTLWCTVVYSNPFYKDGEEIPNKRAMSINLTARTPLFRPDGQPVTVWQKDENGKRVGDAPLPLKADYRLRILENDVVLMMV